MFISPPYYYTRIPVIRSVPSNANCVIATNEHQLDALPRMEDTFFRLYNIPEFKDRGEVFNQSQLLKSFGLVSSSETSAADDESVGCISDNEGKLRLRLLKFYRQYLPQPVFPWKLLKMYRA